MNKQDKVDFTEQEAKSLFQSIVDRAKKEIFDENEIIPKKRDMLLTWTFNKLKYLYTERKYERLKSKRSEYEDSLKAKEENPTLPLSDKLTPKEKTFMKKYEKEYLPGEIINIDLGFNIGREYGGEHYGVVFRKSSIMQNTIYVIPLTSVKKQKEGPKRRHPSEHEIGVIAGLNEDPLKSNVISAAKLMSTMEVSKFRLLESGKKYGKLSSEQMESLREAFFKFMFAEEYKALKKLKESAKG